MSINKYLLWEKWRPKTMNDIILLPRIRKQFDNGVSQHFIFYGSYGCGKTSLARILIGKYTKSNAFLELNCSFDTSIELLRNEIDNFCRVSPIMDTESDIKFVFLDEFDRVSPQFQDAFKAFIEKYNSKVRFIIGTNHISKISDGIKSRIKCLSFDCVDHDEEKYLKVEIYKRIFNKILPDENKEIKKEDLISIINKKFPDFRNIIVEVQNFLDTGESSMIGVNVSVSIRNELYKIITSNTDYLSTYSFILKNFGPDKIHLMISLLGKQFIDYCIENKKNIDNLFECNYIIADYSSKLDTNTDPVILAMTIIGKLQSILGR